MTQSQPIRVLLVEDDQADRCAVERLFVEQSLPYELIAAKTVAEATARLREDRIGLVLIAHGLPDGTGLDVQKEAGKIPSVFITAAGDVSLAVKAMKAGATDFLVKDSGREYLKLLPLTIENTLQQAEHIQARRRAEEALQDSEERYRALFEQAADSIVLIDTQTEAIVDFNERTHKNLGYTREEFQKLTIADIEAVESAAEVDSHLRKIVREGSDVFETKQRTKTGEIKDILVRSRPISLAGKSYVSSVWRDVTDRKKNERALRLSHRCLEMATRHTQMNALLEELVEEVKSFTGCSAVGIRVLDASGRIPYEAYQGFSRQFYESENPLSVDSDHCMCIQVIRGEADPSLPFYTERGSFYINGTTRFLATVSEEEKGKTRNVCNQAGYESVGLVPIRMGEEILGMIHVADEREDMVPLSTVQILEQAGMQLGATIRRFTVEKALQTAHDRLERRVRDRTEDLVKVNEQLQREMQRRERAEAFLRRAERLSSLGTLAAGIAHEINNPVGAALLAAESALDIKDDPDKSANFEACLRNVIDSMDRCGRIVGNLLTFSREESSEKKPHQINDIVRQSWNLTRTYAQQHLAAVRFVLDKDLQEIAISPLDMELVVVNFLRNAIEATDQDGQVTVRTEPAEEGATISIEDNGHGMTEDETKHVFDPFFTTRQAEGGTGLGTSIAYGIVQDHRGTIEVQSEPGQGTIVTITLPCRQDLSERDPREE